MVSHDREFLDTLCQHTLFLFPPDVELRRCPYSIAAMEIERERNYQNFCYLLAKKEVKKLKKKVTKQRAKAQRSDTRLSKSNLDAKDHDAKSKKNLARYSGKDGIEGQTHRRLKSRLEKAQTKQDTIRFVKKKPLGISIKEDRQSRNFPIIIKTTEISLGKNKLLRLPELTIQRNEKIGIVGDNGSGKSTFVNYFIESSKIATEQIVYIPQEIPVEKSKLIVKEIQNYGDIKLGQMMTMISRLGSDPTHVLETEIPSPGEVRKLMLAEGIIKNPSLIIMDEPTNHMDLPSIQCIETALNECTCALLLVSHDLILLQNIVHYFWHFHNSKNDEYQVMQKKDMTDI
jgi:ATPase subunit of ABC transporter with duplicated ATPase domains